MEKPRVYKLHGRWRTECVCTIRAFASTSWQEALNAANLHTHLAHPKKLGYNDLRFNEIIRGMSWTEA